MAVGQELQPSAQIDLACRRDFSIGNAQIRPSLRTIATDNGDVIVEPRVMQVLIALSEAKGAVLSRETLLELCWKGLIVGDDAINRAIGELRRAAREVDAEFEVETIARVGYRLKGEAADALSVSDSVGPRSSRRHILAGLGLLSLAGIAGVTIYLARDDDPGITTILGQARQSLREELPDRDAEARDLLLRAVRVAPGNSEAWGLLAVAWRNIAENSQPHETSEAVRACEQAARRSLDLNAKDGNALSALAALQPFYGDWQAAEQRFLDVLAIAPNALPAISHLTTLYQSTGQLRKSRDLNQRAIALDPLSPVFQFREALKDWIFGAVDRADARIDRALQLWPRHPGVWNARLMLFAYTGRARAGLAMLTDASASPPHIPPATMKLWQLSLEALDAPVSTRINATRQAFRDSAMQGPVFAINSIMVLSSLGELDSAFEIANGFFLRRGKLIGRSWAGDEQMHVNDQRWRRSMFLFTPATVSMRSDARFDALCAGMGLTEYWNSGNAGPDFREFDAGNSRAAVGLAQ